MSDYAIAVEEIARMHEAEAQRLNRLRDPGMANHHRAWAAHIRKLTNKNDPENVREIWFRKGWNARESGFDELADGRVRAFEYALTGGDFFADVED